MLGYIAPGSECELLDSHIKKDSYGYKICKVIMLDGDYKGQEGWTDLAGLEFNIDIFEMNGVPFGKMVVFTRVQTF
eukprot:SAG31_NODE_38898_length_292_cov_1.072539_1_plen_75_part_10